VRARSIDSCVQPQVQSAIQPLVAQIEKQAKEIDALQVEVRNQKDMIAALSLQNAKLQVRCLLEWGKRDLLPRIQYASAMGDLSAPFLDPAIDNLFAQPSDSWRNACAQLHSSLDQSLCDLALTFLEGDGGYSAQEIGLFKTLRGYMPWAVGHRTRTNWNPAPPPGYDVLGFT